MANEVVDLQNSLAQIEQNYADLANQISLSQQQSVQNFGQDGGDQSPISRPLYGSEFNQEIPILGGWQLGEESSGPGWIRLSPSPNKGGSFISVYKTIYDNSQNGFLFGIDDADGDKMKLYLGDSASYLNWDGTNLFIKGAVITLQIVSGAPTGGSEGDIVLDNINDRLYVKTGGVWKSTLLT